MSKITFPTRLSFQKLQVACPKRIFNLFAKKRRFNLRAVWNWPDEPRLFMQHNVCVINRLHNIVQFCIIYGNQGVMHLIKKPAILYTFYGNQMQNCVNLQCASSS